LLSFFVRLQPGVAEAAGQPAGPAGVDWGQEHFTAQKTLAAWLTQRGADYQVWLRRHPSGGYLLTHAAPHNQTTRPAAGVAHAGPDPVAGSRQGKAVAGVLYAAALLLLLLAALPHTVYARVGPEAFREQSLRVGSATIGLAIALGATVALFV
jgi:hypothetical protein